MSLRGLGEYSGMDRQHDIVIIGAGQAGLAMSYWLRDRGREHVVLERAGVAERWRRERWDSLHFQFPNSFLRLPGHHYDGSHPQAFAHYPEILRYIEDYRVRIEAPVECGVEVRSLTVDDRHQFCVTTDRGILRANSVVIATGPFQRPMIPACARSSHPEVFQLHASGYRNPQQLPPGPVLVVGSGSSGCQIAEELRQNGRTVYLSVGRHRRTQHRYRGRYMLEWLADVGLFDVPVDSLPGGQIPPPLVVTGVDGGNTIDLRRFAAEGIVLLGKLLGIDDGKASFASDVEERLTEADVAAKALRDRVDDYVLRTNVPASDPDPDLFPEPRSGVQATVTSLDLRKEAISTIIWCTGYDFDFQWVRLPIFDENARPLHQRGVTNCPGAYFLGLHWMHTFSSGTLFGVGRDAEFLADKLANGGGRHLSR